METGRRGGYAFLVLGRETPPMLLQNDRQASQRTVDDTRPASFRDRGVTVPFTTPALLGCRLRLGERQGLEVAVPNPGGVRGFYVVPLKTLHDHCNPTLHDRLLTARLKELGAVTPEAVLAVSRAAAREGLAGRTAAAAAAAAEKATESGRLLMSYHLLLLLIRQTEGAAEAALPPERDTLANVQRRGERAMARIVRETGMPSPAVMAVLEELADVYLPVGVPGDLTKARHQRDLAALEELATGVSAWGETTADRKQAGAAALILRSARLTLSAGRSLMNELLDVVGDLRDLLRRWSRDAATIRLQASRLSWLLDGWPVMTGLWRFSELVGRPVAVREMAVMVPSIPQEVSTWTGEAWDELYVSVHKLRSRFVFPLEAWRTGSMVDVIARNELILGDVVL